MTQVVALMRHMFVKFIPYRIETYRQIVIVFVADGNFLAIAVSPVVSVWWWVVVEGSNLGTCLLYTSDAADE